jgi:hypothetical protein
MKEYKIEKDIPIPDKNESIGIIKKYNYPFMEMEVGDSFFY